MGYIVFPVDANQSINEILHWQLEDFIKVDNANTKIAK